MDRPLVVATAHSKIKRAAPEAGSLLPKSAACTKIPGPRAIIGVFLGAEEGGDTGLNNPEVQLGSNGEAHSTSRGVDTTALEDNG